MKIYKLTGIDFVRTRILVSVLGFVCIIAGRSFAQEFKTVHDGVEYADVTKEISGLKVNMNLLRVDLTKVRLDVNHAMDAAIGTEKTSSIATRHGAVAAINAGFFRLDTSIWAGDAAGVLTIDGKLLSKPNNERTALMIKNREDQTEIAIDKLSVIISLSDNRPSTSRHFWSVSGLNRERKDDEIIIYSPEFGRTTLTNADGLEITVTNGRIKKISNTSGSSPIPNNGFVVSASGKKRNELSGVRVGEELKYYLPQSPGTLTRPISRNGGGNENALYYEDMVGGVPQLIKNGKIDITWEQEKSSRSFVETRHPRTAVAKLKDGKFLMITVDGRSESSGGIGLQDLAEYLLSLGAVDAMNLDGGGSTTMFLDGKVVNHPSDKEGERKVGDAILVTLRKKPDLKSKGSKAK